MRLRKRQLVQSYLCAKERVVQCGFSAELDWQEALSFSRVSESEFLREAAWVILSSGMRESVVRDRFIGVSRAFRQWRGATEILRHRNECEAEALEVFRHRRKIGAIVVVVERVGEVGFLQFKQSIRDGGVEFLQTLDFIGPVTRYHLAKNIGLDLVKPDRHLVRVAEAAGYPGPNELCQVISEYTGDRLSVVDLVIWRFATIEPHYLECFSKYSEERAA